MAKPLRIGGGLDVEQPLPRIVAELQRFEEAGFAHAFASQIFGPDALTLLAVAGAQVPRIELGTGVVPVYPRHPMMLAQQALTVQAATGNRLLLGIGLSHQVVVEGMWGYSFDRPLSYMREYLASLMPLLHGETVSSTGERVTTNAFSPVGPKEATAPPVLVAALGTAMLRLAGTVADGTMTWMTGVSTVRDHIVPTIVEAAAAAGRPAPRVFVALPVVVTSDVAGAKERIDKLTAIYPTLPSYRAMLDKEGAASASDIALVGSESAVVDAVGQLAEAGATDFVTSVIGDAGERDRTFALLSELARA
jgi:5,10-methylenetetrahydromethanopterin reductase